jgi:hypothetical protein
MATQTSSTKLGSYQALCLAYLPAFFSSNWKWFSFHYPCEDTQSIYMRSYAVLLLRHNIGKAKFFEAIDKALTRPISDKNKNDWPSPIEFVELCS